MRGDTVVTHEEVRMSADTSVESNKAVVRRELRELWEERNLDALDDLYAEDVVVGMTRTGSVEQVVGRDDLRAVYEDWYEAFPDLTVDVEVEAAEGDVVMHYLTMRGTHTGPFRGVGPTGNEVEVKAFHYRRVRDGKVVETGAIAEMMELLRQIGVESPISV
jgi:steroid delta-isomerase-like uncharacterized protein